MLPLLYRDHLILPYVALLTLFAFTHYSPYRRCNKGGIDSSVLQKVLRTSSLLCSLVLHLIYLTLQPPKKYPFLFEALIMILCFSQFVIITIYANRKQWMLLDCSVELENAKKTLWSVIWQTNTVSLWKLIYFCWTKVIVFYTETVSVLLTLYGVFPNFTTQFAVCARTQFIHDFLYLIVHFRKLMKIKSPVQECCPGQFDFNIQFRAVLVNFDFWLFDSVKTHNESLN